MEAGGLHLSCCVATAPFFPVSQLVDKQEAQRGWWCGSSPTPKAWGPERPLLCTPVQEQKAKVSGSQRATLPPPRPAGALPPEGGSQLTPPHPRRLAGWGVLLRLPQSSKAARHWTYALPMDGRRGPPVFLMYLSKPPPRPGPQTYLGSSTGW